MTWIDRVAENIFPLSEEQDDLCTAMKEWEYTGISIDRGEEDDGEEEVDCEMCNHHDLRYHFKIRNTITCRDLWVGSKCVLRYKEEVRNIPQLIADKDDLEKAASKRARARRKSEKAEAARIAHEAEVERQIAAKVAIRRNILRQFVDLIRAESNTKSQSFCRSIAQHYLTKGWISPNQMKSLLRNFLYHSMEINNYEWVRVIGGPNHSRQCEEIMDNPNIDPTSYDFVSQYVTCIRVCYPYKYQEGDMVGWIQH